MKFGIYSEGAFLEELDPSETNVIIPDNYNGIPVVGIASVNNTLLQSIAMPDSIVMLNQMAFLGCSQLQTVKLSSSLSEIPTQCFAKCTSLTKIKLPKSVRKIGMEAFACCTNLEEINLEFVERIDSAAFYNTALKDVVLEDLASAGDSIFKNCKFLENVDLSLSIMKEVPRFCFYGCKRLKTVQLPSSVNKTGIGAFKGCASLDNLSGVSSFKYGTVSDFEGCSALGQPKISSLYKTAQLEPFSFNFKKNK